MVKKKRVRKRKKISKGSRKKKRVQSINEKKLKKIRKDIKQIKIKTLKKSNLDLIDEKEIAMDFAVKVYKKFDKLLKAVILFGSTAKETRTSASDIDIIILIDDASVQWDAELIAWYREELAKLIMRNPYKKELHINSVKLTTWWHDLIKGDPIIINILRYGEALIDFGGFFNPLKALLLEGKIKSTPEAIYTALQRAPQHLARSRAAELSSIEGVYWAMVDSAHAALMTNKKIPSAPDQIALMLKEEFVDKKLLDKKYAIWYRDVYILHKNIIHGNITDLKGTEIVQWQDKAEEFIKVMSELIKKIID